MKLYTLLALFLLFIKANGQELNFWKDYYPHINSAENFLVEDNMYDALKQYSIAFGKTDEGLLKDYFNAAVCASYLGDADVVYDMFRKLASKGLSLEFVKNEVVFSSIQQDVAWASFEQEYLELYNLFNASLNPRLTETLQILVNRDDYFRKSIEVPADSLALIDAQNSVLLDTLISQFGFPGENEIGIGLNGIPHIEPAFYEIIKRQHPENQTINFSNQILEANRNGKIETHLASRLLAIINANDLYFTRLIYKIQVDNPLAFSHIPNAKKLNEWVYLKIPEEDERQIDQLRLNNGMETLKDYGQKILFSLQEHRFLLPYKVLAGVWYVTDAQLANDYLEGAVLATRNQEE
jgi:hypothetical protein